MATTPTEVAPASDEPSAETPANEHPPRRAWHRIRHRWFRYTLPGLWAALLFAWLSFTPSLLPRSGFLQGLVTGITGAIGYGLGVTAAWVWRAFADREPRPTRRRSWQVFAAVAIVALLVALVLGLRWQNQITAKMGMADQSPVWLLAAPVVAALVFVGLVGLSRELRRVYRWAARQLSRWIGPRAARAV